MPTVQIDQKNGMFSWPCCHRQCTLSASHFQKAGMNSSLLGLRTNSSSYDSMKIPVILPAIDLPFPVLCLCPNVTLKVLWMSFFSAYLSFNNLPFCNFLWTQCKRWFDWNDWNNELCQKIIVYSVLGFQSLWTFVSNEMSTA